MKQGPAGMARECYRYTFQGQVQGVGFRYSVARLAQSYEVRGYVRNLPDRCVELVVEGEGREIIDFVESIRNAFPDNIDQMSRAPEIANPEFLHGFSIRF